jgi:hemoglobin
MRRKAILGGLALALALGLGGCPSRTTEQAATAPTMAEPSLYERLGGLPAIEAVTAKFLENVGGDERINARFANTDLDELKRLLVEQICEATGGPCTYTGKDMRTAHAGMNISEAEFNAMGEDLAAALDFYSVPEREKSELLGAIGGMKGDIVGL